MVADNMKTAFHIPTGVKEDFIENLIWQHHQQQHQKNNINQQQQQSIKQFTSEGVSKYTQKRPVLKSLFNKVSGLQSATLSKKRLRHMCFSVKLLRTRFFIEHLRTATSGRAQDFTKNGPSSNS